MPFFSRYSKARIPHLLDAVFIVLVIGAIATLSWLAYTDAKTTAKNASATRTSQFATAVEKEDKYTRFSMELYDIVKEHYWKDLSDADLANLSRAATKRAFATSSPSLATTTRSGVAEMLHRAYARSDRKTERAVLFARVVLANLQPNGRSRLMTRIEERDFRNDVANKDPERSLYDTLNISPDASSNTIKERIAQKEKALEGKESTTTEKEREQLEEAKETLTDPEEKQRYDTEGVRSTVAGRLLHPSIYYIKLEKISPTTIQDLVKAANNAPDDEAINTLVLDLRGNIGGSVDILPYILGPFLGPNQNAYQFFHQGERSAKRTKTGWLESLVKYKKVVVLIDGNTQSSAETMAAALKTYNVGVLVGEKTRGWGTIEDTYPIETRIHPKKKYVALLVNNLTLRPDGRPIQDNGVDPDVSIGDDDWRSQLRAYYPYPPLINAIADLYEEQ